MKANSAEASRTTCRPPLVRVGLAGTALVISLFGAAAGATSGRGLTPGLAPDASLAPEAPGAPVQSPGQAPPPAPDGAPVAGPGPAKPTGPVPGAPARTAAQETPGSLFSEEGGPVPTVSNISLTGEAYVLRQDLEMPAELIGRYPRSTVDVSRDLTTAFAAYADPGMFGRRASESELDAAGDPTVSEPAWAECVFPKSPLTPAEAVRGQGAGPTAAVKCQPGAAVAQALFARDPGRGATAGVALFAAGGGTSNVDATSNLAGATASLSQSSMDNVNLAGFVKIAALTNGVSVRTNGRPGGALVETSATIAGLEISGQPVELPSDSLEQLGPVLAQLAPVITPLGALTFDVIPEQKQAAADGTDATGRAAQLLVTVKNGESTVSFGLGFASARGRTILATAPVPTKPAVPPFRPIISSTGVPLRFGSSTGPQSFVDAYKAGLGGRSAAAAAGRSNRPGLSGPGFGSLNPAARGGLPTTGLNLFPPARAPAQNAADNHEDYGGDGPWIALIGGSMIALGLARYLAYAIGPRSAVPA